MERLLEGEPELGSTGQCYWLASNKTEKVTGRWVFQAASLWETEDTVKLGNGRRVS